MLTSIPALTDLAILLLRLTIGLMFALSGWFKLTDPDRLPGALVLLVITLGALVTTAIPKAEGKGVHKLENVLYAPETLLAVGLLVLVAVGAGAWSLDGVWQ